MVGEDMHKRGKEKVQEIGGSCSRVRRRGCEIAAAVMVLRRAIPVSRRRLGSSWWGLNEEGCGGDEGAQWRGGRWLWSEWGAWADRQA
jgi:hypothetical protein